MTPRREFGRAFVSLDVEHGFEKLEREGNIPTDLCGTLYRNGPALFESHDLAYTHWFDGDGAVSAVRFADGGAEGAVRVVQSRELRRERAAGRALYSSGFTRGPVWWRRLGARAKNTSSINVLSWQSRIFALPELERPHELDPESLETLGVCDLDGVLHQTVQAHFRVAPQSGEVWAFALTMGLGGAIAIYALPKTGRPRRVTKVPLRGMRTFVHDFAMSERYLVFFVPPVGLSLAPALLGSVAPPNALTWQPERGTEIVVVDKRDPKRVMRITTDAFFQTHFVNAFDAGRQLYVDFSRYPDFTLGDAFMLDKLRDGSAFDALGEVALSRARIDLDEGTFEVEPLVDGVIDFATTAPQTQGLRARFAYALETEQDRDLLVKVDLEARSKEALDVGVLRFPGEPTYVPRGSREDDGWLLSMVYDAESHRSGVVVVDAKEMKVLGFVWYAHHIPPPLHGCWVPRAPRKHVVKGSA